MRIEEYTFGNIVIDGEKFTNDVIVFPDRVRPEWWREDGHTCNPEDIQEVVAYDPEIVIIGTGDPGRMDVPEKTRELLGERKIELISTPTRQAVSLFNEKLENGQKVAGAFHLTC